MGNTDISDLGTSVTGAISTLNSRMNVIPGGYYNGLSTSRITVANGTGTLGGDTFRYKIANNNVLVLTGRLRIDSYVHTAVSGGVGVIITFDSTLRNVQQFYTNGYAISRTPGTSWEDGKLIAGECLVVNVDQNDRHQLRITLTQAHTTSPDTDYYLFIPPISLYLE